MPTLVYFMRDRDEDVWVRRHIPATLARIPCAATLQALLERARRPGRLPALQGAGRPRAPAPHAARPHRAAGHHRPAGVGRNGAGLRPPHAALQPVPRRRPRPGLPAGARPRARSTTGRSTACSRCSAWATRRATSRRCATRSPRAMRAAASSAAEFLDNILKGESRGRGSCCWPRTCRSTCACARATRCSARAQRDVEDTLAQLVHDDSQEVAATAIQLVETRQLWSLAGRPRARARAPPGPRLVGVRSGVVGAGRAAHAGRAPARAVAGAAAGRGARRPAAPHPALRLRLGRRAVPRGQPGPPGAARGRPRDRAGGARRRHAALRARRTGGRGRARATGAPRSRRPA